MRPPTSLVRLMNWMGRTSPEAVTVYWTAGRGAYALSGSGSEPDLGRAAATLAALQH